MGGGGLTVVAHNRSSTFHHLYFDGSILPLFISWYNNNGYKYAHHKWQSTNGRQVLKKKSNQKSTGPDNISPKLLKLAVGAIFPSLISFDQYSIEHIFIFLSSFFLPGRPGKQLDLRQSKR